MLAAKGLDMDRELDALDGMTEHEPTFPDVNQLLDHALEGVTDPVDQQVIEDMRRHWAPLSEPRQAIPEFIPDRENPQ
jgi:hypothetical protein